MNHSMTVEQSLSSEFTRGFMCGLDSAVAAFESAVNEEFPPDNIAHELAAILTAILVTAVAQVRAHLSSSTTHVVQ